MWKSDCLEDDAYIRKSFEHAWIWCFHIVIVFLPFFGLSLHTISASLLPFNPAFWIIELGPFPLLPIHFALCSSHD